VSSSILDQKSNIRFHKSVKGTERPKISPTSSTSSKNNEEAVKSPPTVGNDTSIDRLSKWGVWFEETEPTNRPPDDETALESTPDLQRDEPFEPTSSLMSDRAAKSEHRVQIRRIEPKKSSSTGEGALESKSKAKPKRTKPSASLFEELFPEESETKKGSERKMVEKLPAFEWDDAPEIDWNETVESLAEGRKNHFETPTAPTQTGMQIPGEVKRAVRSELSVLVLSCASKTLEESDFFRLGSKGQHIEGWTSGIIKGTIPSTHYD
jgi:hypothetical protein